MKINQILAATTLWMGQLLCCCNGIGALEQRVEHVKEAVFQEMVTRAAFDIGSGEVKMIVCDVDPATNQVAKIWHSNAIVVELRKDQSSNPDGSLSSAVEQQLIAAIKTLQQQAVPFNPQKFAAVGTSVFRTAKNGPEVLERVLTATGLEIQLIPQIEEGKLGFATAVATSHLPPEMIINWDIGAGSNQITAMVDGAFKMYGIEFSYVKIMQAIFEMRKQTFSPAISPNPVSRAEGFELMEYVRSHLPPKEAWMNDPNKKAISIDQLPVLVRMLGHNTFTKQEVLDLLETLYDKDCEQLNKMYPLKNSKNIVAFLTMIYVIMDHCGFDSLTDYGIKTAGNGLGLTITPSYWNDYVDFVLVRHGETHWNEAKEITNPKDPTGPKIMGPVIQGSSDIELNAKGEKQAAEAAEKIAQKKLTFKQVVSSPLKRAAKTADHIAQRLGMVPVRDPNFSACSWGDCEGRVKEYRQALYGYDLFGNYRGSDPDWRTMPTKERWDFNPIPDADTTNSLVNRMKESFKRIASECEDQDRILVVTHQENMKSFILDCNERKIEEMRLNGQFEELVEFEKAPIANCSLHRFRFDRVTEEFSYLGAM